MTVNKQFSQHRSALDGCMDQLVEALAQLLEEPQNPPETVGDPVKATAGRSTDLRIANLKLQSEMKPGFLESQKNCNDLELNRRRLTLGSIECP